MSDKNMINTSVTPLVSVIIPTYNRGKLLARAVGSVLSQSYLNLECIVADDCSTDDSISKLEELFGLDERLIIKRHTTNLHASAARNTGIAAAKGTLIAFLDDDDEWLQHKLSRQVPVLLESGVDTGMVYCWLEVFDGEKSVSTVSPVLEGYVFDECLAMQPLGNASTILIRSEVIQKIGLFDTSLPRGNDGDFIRRIAQYYKVKVVKEILVKYYVNHNGNPRISLNSKSGIRKSVFSQEVKLRKFASELAIRPVQHQLILISIARGYLSIGNLITGFKALFQAILLNPLRFSVYITPFFAFRDFLSRILR